MSRFEQVKREPVGGYATVPEKSFEFGLQAIFDGLEVRLAAGRTRTRQITERAAPPGRSVRRQ
jgi:hypothetical protein